MSRPVTGAGTEKLSAAVHFLNVGWGDAHLIRLPSGELTLIDGGDGGMTSAQDHPLSWMEREGVSRLDWMILTHIHEDHLNGLIDIARNRDVRHAVLPYEIPAFSEFSGISQGMTDSMGGEVPMASRVYGMLQGYRELIALLEKQGTDIRWRSQYGTEADSVIWEEGPYRLIHLYPWIGDPLPGLDVLHQLSVDSAGVPQDRFSGLADFFDRSNDDSSVYQLVCADEPEAGVVFGGDQTIPGWLRLAQRCDLKCAVLKVPHHGLEDAFSSELLEFTEPQYAVIPITPERSRPWEAYWSGLKPITTPSFN